MSGTAAEEVPERPGRVGKGVRPIYGKPAITARDKKVRAQGQAPENRPR